VAESERSAARNVQNLPDMAGTLFSLILSLRTSSNYGSDEELRRKILGYLDQIDKEGLEAGIAREDLEAARYPLVAFIDETILNSEWKGRESWRERPLQLELYGETIAGERFFERLDKIRRAGDTKADLLEIYYLCLALGFEGKYKISGPAKLRELLADVRRELGGVRSRATSEPLSPHDRRDPGRAARVEHGVLSMKTALIAAGGLVLLFLLLFFVIGRIEAGALRELQLLPG
jgi:type VI secretion system protein ImpK